MNPTGWPHGKIDRTPMGTVAAALLIALAMFAGLLLVTPAAAATGTSTLAVTSQNMTGASLTGYYVTLSQGGVGVANAFTPASFTLNNGQNYLVEAYNYGNCSFDHWSDTGGTGPARSISIDTDTQITAVYDCGTAGSSLTVNSFNQNGVAISGFYTALSFGGDVVATGFTSETFATAAGDSYSVVVDNYGNCTFSGWSDGVTTNPRDFTATGSAMTVNADFVCTTTSASNVKVDSQDQNGNTIAGFYTVLYSSSGTVLDTGYTPDVFNTTAGQSYQVSASSYGNCTFSQWSDGVTSNPIAFTAAGSSTAFTAVYNCGGASPYSTVTVNSVDQDGNPITGYSLTFQGSSGNTLGMGTTAATFNATVGQDYMMTASDSNGTGGSCTFSYWASTTTNDLPLSFTATSSGRTFTAVYECNGGGSSSITVYAHRAPASYWAPCFAAACAAGSGPGASMYFALYTMSGTVVATGFSNENGLTFSGLTPGTTYLLQADDCDSCHGSTHDVLFDHWSDGNTTEPVMVVAGTSIDAWYTCTNGCSGGP